MRNIHNVISDVLEQMGRSDVRQIINVDPDDPERHVADLKKGRDRCLLRVEFFINANGGITAAVLERIGFSVRFQDTFMDGVMSAFCDDDV